eukprot:jgi/Tetstr1/441188/TSEL_029445.t1
MAPSAYRLELFLKDASQVPAVARTLVQQRVQRVNLPNKARHEPVLETVRAVLDAFHEASGGQKLDACPHFSLKNQWVKSEEETLQRLKDFAVESAELGCRSILLVSGGGHKKTDSAGMLAAMAAHGGLPAGACAIHCAYNPYFPDEGEQQAERHSLRAKLESRLCSGVWLQIGSDVARLERELLFVEQLQAEVGVNVQLHGSIFLPSKQLLAQQRFRPWRGVFLSQEYLNDPEAAKRVTRQVVEVYNRFAVMPLVESAVKKDADFAYMHSVLEVGATSAGGPGHASIPPPLNTSHPPESKSKAATTKSRAELEKMYTQLTKVELPSLARDNRWPLRLDHCFMRVLLDNTFEDCWYNHLDRKVGALRSIPDDKLTDAVQIGERIRADTSGDVLRTLNARSLKWRGKSRGTKT